MTCPSLQSLAAARRPLPAPTRLPPPPLQIVTPIFAFLAIEVDKKGTNKVEIGCRYTYCDVNESLCVPDVVHKASQEPGEGCRPRWKAARQGGHCFSWACMVCCVSCPSRLSAVRHPAQRQVFSRQTAGAALPSANPQTLGRLGVQWDKRTRAMRVPRDLYSNLVAIGNVSISVTNGTDGAAPGPARVDYDVKSARDW